MKQIFKKIICAILAIVTCFSYANIAIASTKGKSPFKDLTYVHQSKFDNCNIVNGLDISKYDGTINFNTLKKNGVNFVIIRVGYRGYASKGTLCSDPNFVTNIEGAKAAGIKVGVYFYSQAVTTTEAVAEANYVYSKIKNYSLDLPVAFDYEFAPSSSGRLNVAWKNGTLNKTKMTNIALAFCNKISDYGYSAMVYANKSFLTTQLNSDLISQTYPIWLAHYTTSTDYTGDYFMWQYTSTGNCSGIGENIDCNFMYEKDFLEITGPQKRTYTGEEIKPKVTVNLNTIELQKDVDYTVEYKNNIEIGKATIKITGIGEYEGYTKTYSFVIVPNKTSTPKLDKRTSNSLSISWDPSTEDIDGYQIRIYKSGKWQSAGFVSDANTYTINSLSYASNYKITTRAFTVVNGTKYYGYESDILKTGTKPAKVSGLSQVSQNASTIKLKWNAQKNATGYYVQQYSASQGKYIDYKYVEGGKNNTIAIKNLKTSTNYKFRVKAYKYSYGKDLYGSYSDGKTVGTSTAAPLLSSATSKSTKTIKTIWKKTNKASGYQIQWSTSNKFSNKKTKTISNKYLTSTFSVASSNKKYYIRIRTYRIINGKKIYSPYSNVKTVISK